MATATAHSFDTGAKTKVKGLITARTGETLVVSSNGSDINVVLTDDTKVQRPKRLGIRKQQMSMAALIPGNVMHGGLTLTDCRVFDLFAPVREDYR